MKKLPATWVVHEGLRIDIATDDSIETGALYSFMLQLSASLNGRAVLCLNFLPGISLSIECGRGPCDQADLDYRWQNAHELIARVIEDPDWHRVVTLHGLDCIDLARAVDLGGEHAARIVRHWRGWPSIL